MRFNSNTSILVCMRCNENINFGQKGCVSSLTPKLHFNIQEEVFGFPHLPLKIHYTGIGIKLSGIEVVFFISFVDCKDYVVSGISRRGTNSENMSWNNNVCLEIKLIISNAERSVLAIQIVEAVDTFTSPERREIGNIQHFSNWDCEGQLLDSMQSSRKPVSGVKQYMAGLNITDCTISSCLLFLYNSHYDNATIKVTANYQNVMNLKTSPENCNELKGMLRKLLCTDWSGNER